MDQTQKKSGYSAYIVIKHMQRIKKGKCDLLTRWMGTIL